MLHALQFSLSPNFEREEVLQHGLEAAGLHLILASCSKLLPQQDLLTTKAVSSTVLGLVAALTWNSTAVLMVLGQFKMKAKQQK